MRRVVGVVYVLDLGFLYAELKQTVEAVFSHMPQKGPEKILWLVFINYVTYVSEYICNFSNLILESL